MNTRNLFDEELKLLHIDLIEMGRLAEDAISQSVKAFLNSDNTLAAQIVEGDNLVDNMEKQIESRCLSLIIKQQPVARDLRKISSALKMITDLERIGDHAADIAEISLMITGSHAENMVRHIPEMAKEAIYMVHQSIDAFVRNDLNLAKKVIDCDDIVDELFCEIRSEMKFTIKQAKDVSDSAVDFLMIAKYLERIGDHAVNICEWILFTETGVHKNKKIM